MNRVRNAQSLMRQLGLVSPVGSALLCAHSGAARGAARIQRSANFRRSRDEAKHPKPKNSMKETRKWPTPSTQMTGAFRHYAAG
jgi:hypothetical protein